MNEGHEKLQGIIFYDKPVQVLPVFSLGKLRNQKVKNLFFIFRNNEGCSVKRDTDTVNGK